MKLSELKGTCIFPSEQFKLNAKFPLHSECFLLFFFGGFFEWDCLKNKIFKFYFEVKCLSAHMLSLISEEPNFKEK